MLPIPHASVAVADEDIGGNLRHLRIVERPSTLDIFWEGKGTWS